ALPGRRPLFGPSGDSASNLPASRLRWSQKTFSAGSTIGGQAPVFIPVLESRIVERDADFSRLSASPWSSIRVLPASPVAPHAPPDELRAPVPELAIGNGLMLISTSSAR